MSNIIDNILMYDVYIYIYMSSIDHENGVLIIIMVYTYGGVLK